MLRKCFGIKSFDDFLCLLPTCLQEHNGAVSQSAVRGWTRIRWHVIGAGCWMMVMSVKMLYIGMLFSDGQYLRFRGII